MTLNRISNWHKRFLLATCGLIAVATSTGCLQTRVGGQTLPSAYYLRDDVQFYPAGPEFQLPNQVLALENYRLEREAIDDDLAEPAP